MKSDGCCDQCGRPSWVTEKEINRLRDEVKKRSSAIESLCFLLGMIHDKVPHGPGIHQPIKDAIAEYKPLSKTSEATPKPSPGTITAIPYPTGAVNTQDPKPSEVEQLKERVRVLENSMIAEVKGEEYLKDAPATASDVTLTKAESGLFVEAPNCSQDRRKTCPDYDHEKKCYESPDLCKHLNPEATKDDKSPEEIDAEIDQAQEDREHGQR